MSQTSYRHMHTRTADITSHIEIMVGHRLENGGDSSLQLL